MNEICVTITKLDGGFLVEGDGYRKIWTSYNKAISDVKRLLESDQVTD